MTSKARLIALVLLGLLAFCGCSALRSVFVRDASPADAPAQPAADVAEAPGAPLFTFYDSWASW